MRDRKESLLRKTISKLTNRRHIFVVYMSTYCPNLRAIEQIPFELGLFKECASSEETYSNKLPPQMTTRVFR